MTPMFPEPQLFTTFLPQVTTAVPNPYRFGCQVDGDVRGYEKWLVPDRTYQTPYRWAAPDPWFENNLITLSPNPVIVGVKTCPEMYRLWQDRPGSPPKPEYYPIYARDTCYLVDKFNPRAVEVMNEPNVTWNAGYDEKLEVQTYLVQMWLGAWIGDGETSYDAGLRYGEFCRQVYKPIHDAGTIVLAGAIADGDAEFLRGMRDAKFLADVVSYHCYVYPGESFDKVYAYAAVLRQYTDLPFWVTETNVIAPSDDTADTAELRQMQAEYMRYLLKKQAGPYTDIDYISWYGMFGDWRWCGLFRNMIPQPAYEIFRAGK